MESLRVLITVKTYPIPSKSHDELVCTAGVTEDGRWIRLYPINFRDLPFSQQYKKYQWITVSAERHTGRDSRKESYRPDCTSLVLGDEIETKRGDWSQRARYVLQHPAKSMEDLWDQKDADRTSLGVFKPAEVFDLEVSDDDREWKDAFLQELRQARLFETRGVSMEPPRKVPFKFHYRFRCDDSRCKANHRMQIEDWEVGALFWKMVAKGLTEAQAAEAVKQKFLNELCGPGKDTWFFVGTILAHGTWVVIGVFYPKSDPATAEGRLFAS